MSRLTSSNAKETPVLFQELVRLSEHVKIQEENENFSHAVTGLNPSSWIDFLLQLSRVGRHTYATSTGKPCFSKPNQSIWNLAQERHWLAQGPTSQHKVVSSAPSHWPSLGASLLNHSNGQCKQSLKFTSLLPHHFRMCPQQARLNIRNSFSAANILCTPACPHLLNFTVKATA